jgi:poly(A) polymerase
VREEKPVSPAFLFATLLWHDVNQAWESRKSSGERPIPALHAAMDEVLDKQAEQLSIPKRFVGIMKEIWALQPRFEHRSGQRPFRLLETERFRAAYDFLALRCKSGEMPDELGQWWLAFQNAEGAMRADLLKQEEERSRSSGSSALHASGGSSASAAKRRRRPRRRRSGEESHADDDSRAPSGSHAGADSHAANDSRDASDSHGGSDSRDGVDPGGRRRAPPASE